jgi:hypothetical protein
MSSYKVHHLQAVNAFIINIVLINMKAVLVRRSLHLLLIVHLCVCQQLTLAGLRRTSAVEKPMKPQQMSHLKTKTGRSHLLLDVELCICQLYQLPI